MKDKNMKNTEKFTHLNQSAKDECEKMAEIKCLNPEYVSALQGLWASALDMMTYSENKLGEIYRLSQIVRLFAGNKAKVDSIRDQFAEAKQRKDIRDIQRIAKLAGYIQEEKGFDKMWSTVAHDYDMIVKDYCDACTNPNILLNIPTSEEILEQKQQYYAEPVKEKFDVALQTAEALLNI